MSSDKTDKTDKRTLTTRELKDIMTLQSSITRLQQCLYLISKTQGIDLESGSLMSSEIKPLEGTVYEIGSVIHELQQKLQQKLEGLTHD
jgi:hypothetical protein